MRSPKQRSRSKQNRPRTLGNITNRVFDSSGPEGKVRGTPQQIIEKYQVLARDAQLSNDRVAAENFQQHAEHYTRLLAQATREMQAEADARRIAHEEQQAQQAQQARQRQQHDDRQQRQNGQNGQNAAPQHGYRRTDTDDSSDARSGTEGFSVVHTDSDDTTLVDTPEARGHAVEGLDDIAPASQNQRSDRDNRDPRNEPRGEARSEPRTEARTEPRTEPRKDQRPPRDGQAREGQAREGQPREGQPRRGPRPDRAQPDAPRAEVEKPAMAMQDRAPDTLEGADTPAAKPRRNIRKPRKPAGDASQATDFVEPADPSRAAE